MSNSYQIGNLVQLSVLFTDIDGTPADPSVINLTIQYPDGESTTVSAGFVNPSVGAYQYTQAADKLGRWFYRWWSTGLIQASGSSNFNVTDWA